MSAEDQIRVLYIDDEESLLDLGKCILEEIGPISVDTTLSARDGIRMMAEKEYDVIVSDYQMDDMDGLAFLKVVRSSSSIPFIILTGRGRDDVIIDALNSGANFYLQKTGEPEVLFSELKNKIIISSRRYEAERQIQYKNRVYAVRGAINSLILRIHECDQFLSELCRITVEEGKFMMAQVGIWDADKESFHIITSPGSHDHRTGLLDDLSGSDQTGNRELAGLVRDQNQIIWNTCRNESGDLSSQRKVSRVGDYSVGSFPVKINSSVIGLYQIYAEPGFFSGEIVILMDELSADISYALRTLDLEIQRRSHELTLCEREAWFRLLFNKSQDAIVVYEYTLNGKGKIIEANEKASEIFGFSREEFFSMPEVVLFERDESGSVSTDGDEVFETGEVVFETDLLKKDGGRIRIECNSKVFDLPGRKVLFSIIRASTGKSALNEAIKDLKNLNDTILNSIQGFYFRTDIDGKLLFATASLGSFLGYSPVSNFIGIDVSSFYLDPLDHNKYMDILFRDGHVDNYEITLKKRDGSIVYGETCSAIVYDENGFPSGIEGTFWNVTRRKEIENALKESRDHYQLLADHFDGATWTMDLSGVFTYISPSITLLTGYSPDEIAKLTIDRMMTPESAKSAREILDDIMTHIHSNIPIESRQLEAEYYRKDGSTFWVEETYKGVYNESGTLVSVMGVMRDITERKIQEKEMEYYALEMSRYAEALNESNKKMNLLSSITRHDILNHVTGLHGFIAFAKEENKTESVGVFLDKCEQLTEIIQKQIEFTRVYQNIGVQSPVWQNVQDTVGKVMEENCFFPLSSQVELNGLVIFADPLLEKVFYTFIENTVRHGKKATRFSFSYKKNGNDILIIYEDKGVGIPQGDKDRVFIRGYGNHTGLGLFIAQEILSITGLTIRETGKPGEGVRFEILVPERSYKLMGCLE